MSIKNVNVIIPAAGLGSRFTERNFITSKPLLPIGLGTSSEPMISQVIKSLGFHSRFEIHGNKYKLTFIFIIQEAHNKDKQFFDLINKELPDGNFQIIEINYITQGCTETCLLASGIINNKDPLIIANCDQIMEWDANKFMEYVFQEYENDIDGCVVCYKSTDQKNSFIQLEDNNNLQSAAIKLAEKEIISDIALIGIHYWKHGKTFVDSSNELINKNIRAKNEFYISLTYNILIEQGLNIYPYMLNKDDGEKYHSVGTPDDYFKYLEYKYNANFEITKLEKYWRGWFIGNFEPSVFKTTDFEIGMLLHTKGEKWTPHYHENMTEINLLVSGDMILNDKKLKVNDIFTFKPGQIAAPIFLEDCHILCIKVPSVPGDKVLV
jgi:dTDP-glucose pyrophosphorylase